MLVLTRRRGQILRIGDDISVTILAVKGKRVRLRIDAPTSARVHRAEVELLMAEEGPPPIGLPETRSVETVPPRRAIREPTGR